MNQTHPTRWINHNQSVTFHPKTLEVANNLQPFQKVTWLNHPKKKRVTAWITKKVTAKKNQHSKRSRLIFRTNSKKVHLAVIGRPLCLNTSNGHHRAIWVPLQPCATPRFFNGELVRNKIEGKFMEIAWKLEKLQEKCINTRTRWRFEFLFLYFSFFFTHSLACSWRIFYACFQDE